jgi:hypothetical protein
MVVVSSVMRWSSGSTLESRQEAEAVGTGPGGEILADDVGQGRQYVGEAHRLVADGPGSDGARPADDERHAMPGLPGVGFHPAEASGRVVAEARGVRGIPDGAVVGREHEQGLVEQACGFQHREQEAHRRGGGTAR